MEITPHFIGAYLERDFLWFIDSKDMTLLKIDLKRKCVMVETVLQTEAHFVPRSIFMVNDVFLIASDATPEVILYNIKESKTDTYSSCVQWTVNKWNKAVRNVLYYNNKIIFIPLYIVDGLCFFDLQNNKFSNINILQTNRDKIINDVYLDKDILYLLIDNAVIYFINLKVNMINRVSLPNEIRASAIVKQASFFWLRSKCGYTIYRISQNLREWKEIPLNNQSMKEHDEVGGKLIVASKNIFSLPIKTNTITGINFNGAVQKKIVSEEKLLHCPNRENGTFSVGFAVSDGYVFLFPWAGEYLIRIDESNYKVESFHLHIDDFQRAKWNELILKKKGAIKEKDGYMLNDYIKTLYTSAYDSKENLQSLKCMGQQIYYSISNNINE